MFKYFKKFLFWSLGLVFVLLAIFLISKNFLTKDNKIEKKTEALETKKELKDPKPENELRFGWMSDIHLGDNNHEYKLATLGDDAILRTVPKMINQDVDFIVCTGDMIDNFHKDHDEVIGFHKEVKKLFDGFNLETYYVIGNHDVQTNSKKEFTDIYKIPGNHYSFQKRGVTFIVLDQQFNPNGSSYDEGDEHYLEGSIPESQLEWVKEEIEKAPSKVVVLTHQPLFAIDEEGRVAGDVYTHNGDLLQEILEKSDKVLAVLSGHLQASSNELHREFGGVKQFILPSAIFKDTRLSYGIVKINLDTEEIDFDYHMDENNDKLWEQYESISKKCKGPDEESDYRTLLDLKKNDLHEFQKIEKLFKKYKDTDFEKLFRLSEKEKKQIKDFEDYDCYKNFLKIRQEFYGF